MTRQTRNTRRGPRMSNAHKRAGFTLIELMIVVAVIAIIAAMAIPKMLSARLAANEAAAISTMRSISTGEACFRSTGVVDSDADGAGEFGYLAELAGAVPMRVSAGGVGAAGAALPATTDILNPSILPPQLGAVQNGIVARSGYFYQLWLPDATYGGIPEEANGGCVAGPFPDGNTGEVAWACYAWPMEAGSTGNRAFFVNQEGDVLGCPNRQVPQYTGDPANGGIAPNYDEALLSAGDMSSHYREGVPGGADGSSWALID
ncbi:MAG: prepilin-type N-terminal cleavage/methylation domain-containing protein [Planctomycetes bacterium]|nr:prepilin-type N-terminal cleavage/methylation domain-containing protein [Planctomycetota bacterium]